MTLDAALHILAIVHTRDDPRTGFSVLVGATTGWFSQFSDHEVMEAWKTVRMRLHMKVEPDDVPISRHR